MALINPADGLHHDNFVQLSSTATASATRSLAFGCAELLNALSTAAAATPTFSTNPTVAQNSTTETTSASSTHTPSRSPETTLPSSPITLSSPVRRLSWSDERGGLLVRKRYFSKFDEPYRCGSSPFEAPKLHLDLDINAGASVSGLTFDKTQLTKSCHVVSQTRASKVVLESVNMRLPYVFVVVRVANVAFAKTVNIRMSTDNWQSHEDVAADWVSSSLEDGTERFVATLNLPNFRLVKHVAFCVQFQADGHEFWDSNDGNNYMLTASSSSGRVGSPPLPRVNYSTFQTCGGAFL
jgi:protein phosphatase 1 regulatory subunit 3A/B/C/D/E